MEYLNIERWERKDHFHFFKDFDDPFFNICAEVDVTETLKFTRERGFSFFLTTLYLATKAANKVKEFRYRLHDDKVLVHDRIHPASTVLHEDKSFGFCYFQFWEDFSEFYREAEELLHQFKTEKQPLASQDDKTDVIYYTVLPWMSFTSFKHAKKFGTKDSIPRIAFGKYAKKEGRMKMPVSVEVHHALVDGIHVGIFLKLFEVVLLEPQLSL